MKQRANIEPKQGEMKRYHGLERAKYWGLLKMNIQATISAIVVNAVLHQLDQKIIYPHYDFKHLTEKYFEIGMKLDDFLIQLVKY